MASEKIFITLGSQKFQFDRLLEAVDRLCQSEEWTGIVFAQTGYSGYIPKHFGFKKFLERDEFASELDKADIVITHGGSGAIIGAVKKGKKVIAVPRLAKYGEHVDDHQIQLVEQFAESDLLCPCLNPDELGEALERVRVKVYKGYKSNTDVIIDSIEQYIQRNIEEGSNK